MTDIIFVFHVNDCCSIQLKGHLGGSKSEVLNGHLNMLLWLSTDLGNSHHQCTTYEYSHLRTASPSNLLQHHY